MDWFALFYNFAIFRCSFFAGTIAIPLFLFHFISFTLILYLYHVQQLFACYYYVFLWFCLTYIQLCPTHYISWHQMSVCFVFREHSLTHTHIQGYIDMYIVHMHISACKRTYPIIYASQCKKKTHEAITIGKLKITHWQRAHLLPMHIAWWYCCFCCNFNHLMSRTHKLKHSTFARKTLLSKNFE